jgi:hypothetical protein
VTSETPDPPRPRRKGIYLLPNLLTTVALCSGLASIHFSLKASGLRVPNISPEELGAPVQVAWRASSVHLRKQGIKNAN